MLSYSDNPRRTHGGPLCFLQGRRKLDEMRVRSDTRCRKRLSESFHDRPDKLIMALRTFKPARRKAPLMPIRPAPRLFHCPKCNWNGLFSPNSDCLIQTPWCECPRCAHAPLEHQPAGIFDAASAQIGLIDRR